MRWLLDRLRSIGRTDATLMSKPESARLQQPEPGKFYTIDFDPSLSRFSALFCHGTSSEHTEAILREGLTRPNLERVLDALLVPRPDLVLNRHAYELAMPCGPLGVEARVVEGGVFATWLANRNGVENLASGIGNVVRHGGEVYTVAWNRLSRVIADRGEGELPVRFPHATSMVLFFIVHFDIPMEAKEEPRTEDGFIAKIARDLIDSRAYPDLLVEVRFIDPLPPDRIIWLGTVEQALLMVEKVPVSSRAEEELRSLQSGHNG